MPNWCDCELSVCGGMESVKKFREAVRSTESDLDADKIIPYPGEYRKLDAISEEWWSTWIRSTNKPMTTEERNNLWLKYTEEHGNPPDSASSSRGYEWCTINWGTKWGFCEVSIPYEFNNGVEYHFRTAWSPPKPLVIRLGRMFPELKFQLRYYECDAGFQGSLTMSGGEISEDWSGDYIGTRGG